MSRTRPASRAIEPEGRGGTRAHVVRYNRLARWFHTGVYLVTFVLLATGWWLWAGHEGDPSLLAQVVDRPDTELHRQAGWVLVGLAGAGMTLGIRGAWRFMRETMRVNRGDGRWFWHWPRATLTGRFAHHRGHFDPGQRIANIGFVVVFGTLIGTGIALTTLHGGPAFIWLVRAHRYATVALAALVAGHILIAIGVLPGYRGVWRSMHFGGRVPEATARRLWPRSAPAEPAESAEPAEPADPVERVSADRSGA